MVGVYYSRLLILGIVSHAAVAFPRLGLLTEEDAPRVIHEVCQQEVRPRALDRPPLMARNWRGRMGLSKVESTELWESYIKGSKLS